MEPKYLQHAYNWFENEGWEPFPFQIETWLEYTKGNHGLLNAPTGSGKTYALAFPILLEYFKYDRSLTEGLQALWITPLRALTKDIHYAFQKACDGMQLPWTIGIRTGDTPNNERERQRRKWPQVLITTPETLHLMLAQKDYPNFFSELKAVVVDEWHELLGSKRGVQVELGLSRLKMVSPGVKIWGISATIGNMDEARQALLGVDVAADQYSIVRANLEKKIEVITVMPDTIEKFPWSGHLGTQMLDKLLPILEGSGSTLVFTNTRSQTEIWYQNILTKAPGLAGQIAMHHGSLDKDIRDWVEEAIHNGQLKVVVCTSSLDLGVDFRPVDTIIQIGGPKGVARFLQRAGRSGHRPGEQSIIYFVPTNSLELLEAVAIKNAVKKKRVENRVPYINSYDVLVQYLVTLAISDGFVAEQLFKEVRSVFSFQGIDWDTFRQLIDYVVTGGTYLEAYDEFKKVELINGRYCVLNRKIAMRHRLSIGTIVGDSAIEVVYMNGSRLGTIEEWFISRLSPGDTFWFSGRSLEFVRIKDMKVYVRRSSSTKGQIPSWQGGKMPLSSEMSEEIRIQLDICKNSPRKHPEFELLHPLLKVQQERSHLPDSNEFLVESMKTREGWHVFFFPFEGRNVHEGLANLMAYRLSLIKRLSFSIAMNDYGFELLSDQPIPIEEAIANDYFSPEHLKEDLTQSMNITEMASRRFRNIASIAGLVFKGHPGHYVNSKHLQSSAQLVFKVFYEYDQDNVLLQQAYQEVYDFQLEEARLRKALERIANQQIILTYPPKFTPFSFPIMVDRIREKVSYEKLEDRIKRMKLQLEK